MKTTIKEIPVIATLFALTSCSNLPPKEPVNPIQGDYSYVKDYMSWYIQKEMKDKHIVGLSVALVDDQSIIWQHGFGYADKENKIEATPHTRYRAGSISKVFNAMAAMKLAGEGKIDIDRPLVNYLPEFKINSRFGATDGITPRTIMTHHSGLPGDWIDGMWSIQPRPFAQRVDDIKDAYVANAPNTVFAYSNLGVTLLGHALQKVSGKKYADYLDDSLLKPLGMKDSHFETDLSGKMAAKSYSDGKAVTEYPLNDIPAGGLNTTANDLGRLAMMVNNKGQINNHQVLSATALETMLTAQNTNIPLDLGQHIGLAWIFLDEVLAGKEKVYGHDGGTIAHRSSLMVAPKSKLGVVVLANTESSNSNEIAKKCLQLAWEAKTGKKLPKPKTTPFQKISRFEGTYATMMGKADFTKKSSDHYRVKISGSNFDLRRQENGKFSLKYRLLGLMPVNLKELSKVEFYTDDITGHHLIIAEADQYRFLAGVKVEPKPISDAWKDRLGHYKLLNPPEPKIFQVKDFELKLEQGYLVGIVTPVKGELVSHILRTVNDKEAIIEGLGRGLGETIRVQSDNNGREILTHSGLQSMRIQR